MNTSSQERVVSKSVPPLSDIVCWNCKASGHMQRECSQPWRPLLCLHCNKEGQFARECPENLPQDSRVVRAKAPPKQKEKARGRAVSRIVFLVHFPRPPTDVRVLWSYNGWGAVGLGTNLSWDKVLMPLPPLPLPALNLNG